MYFPKFKILPHTLAFLTLVNALWISKWDIIFFSFKKTHSVNKELKISKAFTPAHTCRSGQVAPWSLVCLAFDLRQIPLYDPRTLERNIIITIIEVLWGFLWIINLFLSFNSGIISFLTIFNNQPIIKPKEYPVKRSSLDSSVWLKHLHWWAVHCLHFWVSRHTRSLTLSSLDFLIVTCFCPPPLSHWLLSFWLLLSPFLLSST